MKVATEAIGKVKEELGDKPEDVNRLVLVWEMILLHLLGVIKEVAVGGATSVSCIMNYPKK